MASAPWSAEEQLRLEDGLREFANVQDQKEKWRGIAAKVGTRGAKECAVRYKSLCESVRNADDKATEDAAKEREAEAKAARERELAEEQRRIEEQKRAEERAELERKAEEERRRQEEEEAEAAEDDEDEEDDDEEDEQEEAEEEEDEDDEEAKEEAERRRKAEERALREKIALEKTREAREAREKVAREKAEEEERKKAEQRAAREKAAEESRKRKEAAKQEAERVARENAERAQASIVAEEDSEINSKGGKKGKGERKEKGKSGKKGGKKSSVSDDAARDECKEDDCTEGAATQKGGKGGKRQKNAKVVDQVEGEGAGEAGHAADNADEQGGKRSKGKKGDGKGKKGKGKRSQSADDDDDEDSAVRDLSLPLRDRLAAQLKRGKYECMICVSKVGRGAFIWDCKSCSAMFHLKCIHSWIRKSNEGSSGSKPTSYSWPCPACRYIHVEPRMPVYTCFCERRFEPELSPHVTPHTCGEPCDRKRERCPHACPELCHPGPCPPCTAVGPAGACHCGREQKSATRCGEPLTWSCGDVCDRALACGKHTCPLRCHTGRCPPCTHVEEQSCLCGKSKETRPCGSSAFNCGAVCGKLLGCGHHTCERLCHDGDCGECQYSPNRWGQRCACGRTDTSSEAAAAMLVRFAPKRSSCADRLALCGTVCGRLSRTGCGHKCPRMCHEGPCGPCSVMVDQRCRCGLHTRRVECSVATSEDGGTYLCKTPCKTKKSCQRHKCEVLCCPHRDVREHESHLCLIVCIRPLECGNHNCEEFCHLGTCPPCRVVSREPLCCACGDQSLEPPVRCGTNPPHCRRPCGQELDCGHGCPALCHFGECPPCSELVSKVCIGGHQELPPAPCHVQSGSCGRPCGRALEGCSHHCRKACHAGPCPACEEPCGAPRVHCEHRCLATCHPGSDCPEEPCTAKVKLTCKCGSRAEHVTCGASATNPRPNRRNVPCGPTCGGTSRGRASGEADLRVDSELARLAEYTGVQFFRFFELKLEELAGARPGKTVEVTLSRTDVAAGRRSLAVELARIHYGLQHRASPATAGETAAEGGVKLVFWVEKSAFKLPAQKLSQLLEVGGDVSHGFGKDAAMLAFAGLPRFEEAAEELAYELLAEEELGAFRLRADGSAGLAARFLSPMVAATAFHRLTRQAASPQMQEVRRVPPDRAQRIAKLGAKPRIALQGKAALAALQELRSRQSASGGGAGAGGGGPGAGPGQQGSAWGRGGPGASASAGPTASVWGGAGRTGAAATTPASRPGAGAAGGSAWGAAAGGGRGAAATGATTAARPAAAEAAPRPAPAPAPPPPRQDPDEIPDSWDD